MTVNEHNPRGSLQGGHGHHTVNLNGGTHFAEHKLILISPHRRVCRSRTRLGQDVTEYEGKLITKGS